MKIQLDKDFPFYFLCSCCYSKVKSVNIHINCIAHTQSFKIISFEDRVFSVVNLFVCHRDVKYAGSSVAVFKSFLMFF